MTRTMLSLAAVAAAALSLPGLAYAGGVSLDKSAASQKEAASQQGGPDNRGDFGRYTPADENGDTAISKQEWTAFLEVMRESPDFDAIDSDSNGRIDREEWKQYSENAAAPGAQERAKN